MTPQYAERFNITSHAEDGLEEIGKDAGWLIGRMKNGVGSWFRDTSRGSGCYDFVFAGQEIASSVVVEFPAGEKVVHVKTVFELSDHYGRYHASDRFEYAGWQ